MHIQGAFDKTGTLISTIFHPMNVELAFYFGILLFLLGITRPVYQKFKKDKAGFGTVFDSITGKPIDLARIRLVDVHGLTTTSAVTDRYGHYRLNAAPGEYTIDISKPGYQFPSRFMQKRDKSKMYDNILPSRKIRIKDYGIITKNIPIDDLKATGRRSKVFSRWIALGDNAQLITAYLSPFILIFYPMIRMSIYAWIAYALFVLIVFYRIVSFRPGRPQYGTLKDAKTKQPIQKAVLRLYDAKFNKVLQTQVTSPKGRYAFLVNRGSYYLTIQKNGYRTLRLNFPNITRDSYPLATNIQMKSLERAP